MWLQLGVLNILDYVTVLYRIFLCLLFNINHGFESRSVVIQVEHPCTEMIADVNLPALQLQIGMGIPLHMIRDIRMYFKEDPSLSTKIDFEK